MAFVLVALVVVLADQLSKWWMVDRLCLGGKIPLGVLDLHLEHNTGAAFSILPHAGSLLIVVPSLIVMTILLTLKHLRKEDPALMLPLAMITGGAIGNLIDRLRLGYVVDFIDFRWWPDFNLADSCICIGASLFVWYLLRNKDRVMSPPTLAAAMCSDDGGTPSLAGREPASLTQ